MGDHRIVGAIPIDYEFLDNYTTYESKWHYYHGRANYYKFNDEFVTYLKDKLGAVKFVNMLFPLIERVDYLPYNTHEGNERALKINAGLTKYYIYIDSYGGIYDNYRILIDTDANEIIPGSYEDKMLQNIIRAIRALLPEPIGIMNGGPSVRVNLPGLPSHLVEQIYNTALGRGRGLKAVNPIKKWQNKLESRRKNHSRSKCCKRTRKIK